MEKELNYEPAQFVPMSDLEEQTTSGGYGVPVVIYGIVAIAASVGATVNYVVNSNSIVWSGSLSNTRDYFNFTPSFNFGTSYLEKILNSAINFAKSFFRLW